jgi:hypothetical protein
MKSFIMSPWTNLNAVALVVEQVIDACAQLNGQS